MNRDQQLQQLRTELIGALEKASGANRGTPAKPPRQRPPAPAGVDPGLFAKAVAGDWQSAQEVRKALEKAAPIAPHLPTADASGTWSLIIDLNPSTGAVLRVKQSMLGISIPGVPGKLSTSAGAEELSLKPEQLDAVRAALTPLLDVPPVVDELEEPDPWAGYQDREAERMRQISESRYGTGAA